MYDAHARFVYHPPSVHACPCRLRLVPVDFYHSSWRCCSNAAAAPPLVVSLSYDAVVRTLLELHYYVNTSKNHYHPKQFFTTSKLALYHLCSSWFDGLWELCRQCSWLESVRFLGIIKCTVAIIIRAYTSSNQHSTDTPSILDAPSILGVLSNFHTPSTPSIRVLVA